MMNSCKLLATASRRTPTTCVARPTTAVRATTKNLTSKTSRTTRHRRWRYYSWYLTLKVPDTHFVLIHFPPPALPCRNFHSCIFHLLPFPTDSCRYFHSCIFHSHIFSPPNSTMSRSIIRSTRSIVGYCWTVLADARVASLSVAS